MLELFTALILLSNFLLLFLVCSLLFSEKAVDSMAESDDHEATAAADEANHHVDDHESSSKAESKSNERFLIKIIYEETEIVKQWFVPIISGILDIDMIELRNRITSLFGLPHYSKLDVRCHDEDGALMTIIDDSDLQYVMAQKPEQLKLYFRVINNPAASQVGGGAAGLEPICTPKPTNTPDLFAPLDFGFDEFDIYDVNDWLIA